MAIATLCVLGVVAILLIALSMLIIGLDQHDDCESF